MTAAEKVRLESIAGDSRYAAGANEATIRHSFSIFSRYLRGESILELGPAEGVMTKMLSGLGCRLTVVEGSARFCRSLAERFPSVSVINALFEDFEPPEGACYDNIVLGHVLEHVTDPVLILSRARRWLRPGSGQLLAAVPNARSLHRQAAVIMGLLSAEDALNEMDRHHGHRRVFTPESFRAAFREAGLRVDVYGGYWMKPVSNAQIEANWTAEMLDAFMVLGERYPDIAGEMFIVASNYG